MACFPCVVRVLIHSSVLEYDSRTTKTFFHCSSISLTGSFLFPPVNGRLTVLGLLHFSLRALGVHHRALRLKVDLCLLHFVRLRSATKKKKKKWYMYDIIGVMHGSDTTNKLHVQPSHPPAQTQQTACITHTPRTPAHARTPSVMCFNSSLDRYLRVSTRLGYRGDGGE